MGLEREKELEKIREQNREAARSRIRWGPAKNVQKVHDTEEVNEPTLIGEKHVSLFRAICREFGTGDVVELLVTCFGIEPTVTLLDESRISAVSGETLVAIYMNNR